MNAIDLFWNASLSELKKGFIEDEGKFTCIICGKEIEKGIIYNENDVLYDAGKYVLIHIQKAHQSVFEHLISLDKRFTGLTEHQNNLIKLFYQGKSNEEVKKEMDIGSTATIRNHRFALREKERQAKVFLAIMELLRQNDNNEPKFINFHKGAKMVDDRYNITEEEKEKTISKSFPYGTDGPLVSFSKKEKHKLVILQEIINKFEFNKQYSEKDVTQILKPIFEDHVTLRRYLIEYGFLDRKLDCSQYWRKE